MYMFAPSIRLNHVLTAVLIVGIIATSGCGLFGSTKRTPPPKSYTADWSYNAKTPSTAKVDITIGVVAPQFTGDGEDYYREQKQDTATKELIRAFRTSVPELLIAKGVSTAGPYPSVDGMTYPEKKAADFILYPELDISATYDVGNMGTKQAFMSKNVVTTCTVTMALSGSVQVVLDEPMTSQRMWVKRIPVESEARTFRGEDRICSKQAITQQIKDGWLKMHEALYKEVMSNLDRYVHAEELVALKAQAEELKGKKAY